MKPICAILCFLSVFCLRVQAQPGTITTFAGTGVTGYSGDGGPATNAQLFNPWGVSVDRYGNVFVCDAENNRIRKIDHTNGVISTYAGTGIMGYSGDGGPATSATLSSPEELFIDHAGNVYFSDAANYVFRKIDTSGIITTIIGNGLPGWPADGLAATVEELQTPTGIAIDRIGNIFCSDWAGNMIYKIDTAGIFHVICGIADVFGLVLGYSGDGGLATDADTYNPRGICIDRWGNIFFADEGNSLIRKIDTLGIITTVAGNPSIGCGYSGDGGPATLATLCGPHDVKFDTSGNMYIVDGAKIRMVNTLGTISTIAGGLPGFGGDGGPATAARLDNPSSVIPDNFGNIYVCDNNNNRIRKIGCQVPQLGDISGTSMVCAGTTGTFTDVLSGGTWAITNGCATQSDGVVSALLPGIDTLIYSDTNVCGVATVTDVITIDPVPFAGILAGSDTICVGTTTSLASSSGGGSWSVSCGLATITSSGVLTAGATPGTCTAKYLVSNSCGSDSANFTFTIMPASWCTALGIDFKILATQIKLFPNPASNEVTVTANDPIVYLIVTNLVGETMIAKEGNSPTVTLNISSLAPGIYFVKANGTMVQKLVKQ